MQRPKLLVGAAPVTLRRRLPLSGGRYRLPEASAQGRVRRVFDLGKSGKARAPQETFLERWLCRVSWLSAGSEES